MTTERRTRAGWLRPCLGLGLSGLLFACAAGTPRVASDIEAQVPANLHADYISFTENCNKCHDLERPLRAHIDDVRHWDLYVAKMMRTAGSAISAKESPKILRFLYWYTERKNRLQNERAKEVSAPVEAPAAPYVPPSAPPPAPPAAVPAAEPAAPAVPQPDNTVVNPAPASVKQGEGAP
jgi:hypothetical protein